MLRDRLCKEEKEGARTAHAQEGKYYVCRKDALKCRAHTPFWTAAGVACVMGVPLMDEFASTESDSSTLRTTVSSAPV
ncbi:unnamed protein product, partial [Menidia menidia]